MYVAAAIATSLVQFVGNIGKRRIVTSVLRFALLLYYRRIALYFKGQKELPELPVLVKNFDKRYGKVVDIFKLNFMESRKSKISKKSLEMISCGILVLETKRGNRLQLLLSSL